MDKLFKDKKRFALEQVRSHQRRSIISLARQSNLHTLVELLLLIPVHLPVAPDRFNQLIKSIEAALDSEPESALHVINQKGLERMLTLAKVNEIGPEAIVNTCRCVKRLLSQRHYWTLNQLQSYLELLSKLLKINGELLLESLSCLLRGLFVEDLNQMQLMSSQQTIVKWTLTCSQLIPAITPFVLDQRLSQQALKILVNLTYLHPRFSDKIFKSDLIDQTRLILARGKKEQIGLFMVLISNMGTDGAELFSASQQLLVPLLTEPQLRQGLLLQQLLFLLTVVINNFDNEYLSRLSEQLKLIDFFIGVLQLPLLQVSQLPFIQNSLGRLLQNQQACEQFRVKGGRRLLEELWQNGGQEESRRLLELACRDS